MLISNELDTKTTEASKELSEEEILMYSMFIDDNLYKKKLLKNTCEGVQF